MDKREKRKKFDTIIRDIKSVKIQGGKKHCKTRIESIFSLPHSKF